MRGIIGRELDRNEGLLRHSAIVLVGSVLANAMNYLYQLFMGRMLGPEQYGVLGALFSLLYIVMVAANTIMSTVSRFVTEFKTKKEYGKIKRLLTGTLKRALLAGVVFSLLAFLLKDQIAGFLKIESTFLILLVLVEAVLSLISPALVGTLNGLQRFFTTSVIGVISAFVKLGLGVGLVLLGFGVAGAIGAVIAAIVVGIILYALSLRKILMAKPEPFDKADVMGYAPYAFFGLLLPVVLINLDVLMVKHFFPPLEAGYYAAASTMAKIILFASGALPSVMFPKAAALHDQKKDSGGILKASLFYTVIISAFGVAAYFVAPTFISRLLYGAQYEIAGLIGLFGLAIGLDSLVTVIVTYNLAKKRKRFVALLFIALIIESIGIWLFHGTLLEVVKVVLGAELALLFMLFSTVYADLLPRKQALTE